MAKEKYDDVTATQLHELRVRFKIWPKINDGDVTARNSLHRAISSTSWLFLMEI
jgi:hypothetical protein